MRQFHVLDQIQIVQETGIVSFSSGTTRDIQLWLRREGTYIVVSAVYGPMEMALRLNLQEVVRGIRLTQALDGLQTTRQVGSAQSYIGFGLQMDGALLLRLTIVEDAHGLFAMNFQLSASVAQQFTDWLNQQAG